jgi:glycosyltransferase involved in cell wall biosynthesis
MPRLIYVSLMRLPTEKAHGLQIMQNCEALAAVGYEMSLWVARRINTPQMRQIQDVYAYYGVQRNFKIVRIPILDLMPLAKGNPQLERLPFYIQVVTYILMLLVRSFFTRADVYYSRDETLLFALSLIKPRKKLVYEAHLFSPTKRGAWLQAQVVKRCGSSIAITPKLRDDLIAQRGADPARVLVAHDGIRAERFQNMPSQAQARQKIGWRKEAFIVGFVGRLHMLNMDKGVGTLIEALAKIDGVSLALVGGPDEMAATLKKEWLAKKLPPENFLYAGHVPPDEVPLYLSAFDICAMPHPFNPQFAYYTSPLKLFEYMAAQRAIVASDLPGWADVVQHEQQALLVPPGDITALAQAIQRLKADADLRKNLATAAYERVMAQYTWAARAEMIRAFVSRSQ